MEFLKGITKCMLGSKDDFVLHFWEEQDLRYHAKDTNARKEVIDLIKRLYADKFGKNIPLYAVDVKCLR